MFNNGLLATFVPELLMLIGYLLCLMTPALRTKEPIAELNPTVVQISTTEQSSTSTYSVTASDFAVTVIVAECQQAPLICAVSEINRQFLNLPLHLSDKLSFVQFSRPPTFIS